MDRQPGAAKRSATAGNFPTNLHDGLSTARARIAGGAVSASSVRLLPAAAAGMGQDSPGPPPRAPNDRLLPAMPRLVNTRAAAKILGRSPNTLKRWRYEGAGPAYVAIEGRVSYDVNILLAYIEENTRVPSVRAAREGSREDL